MRALAIVSAAVLVALAAHASAPSSADADEPVGAPAPLLTEQPYSACDSIERASAQDSPTQEGAQLNDESHARVIEELDPPAQDPGGRPEWSSPVDPGDPCDDNG